MATNNLTAQRLREVLHYDPETGVFTWLVPRGRRTRVGRQAGCIGTAPTQGYRLIRIDANLYKASRLAWFWTHGYWPKNDIDHINGVRHDDRIDNLREATRSLNNENQRRAKSHSKSGLLGAHTDGRSGKWTSAIKTAQKTRYLGMFNTPEEAHAAYIAAKRTLHKFGMI